MIPEHYIIEGRGNPTKLLMLIHGYDANEYHLASLGPLMDAKEEYLIVAPRAPIQISERGVSWYDRENKGEVAQRINDLDALINQICSNYNLNRSESVIGGFSQGAGLAIGLSMINNDAAPIKKCIPICGFNFKYSISNFKNRNVICSSSQIIYCYFFSTFFIQSVS